VADAITDEYVVAVLRPFVRANRPVLNALRESDPFGLRKRMIDNQTYGDSERDLKDKVLDYLSAVKLPGTPAWAAMNPDMRCDWWIRRVGRFTSLLAAVPGVGGVLADRLPVQDALGAAGQGLLLCAIAGEYGIDDENDRVRLLASVLFRRDVDAALAKSSTGNAEVEQKAAELTAELEESGRKHGKPTLRAIGRTVWRLGRALWALGDELEKRPQGRLFHKALGMLPVVGALGDYLGERSALRRVAKAARTWIARHHTPQGAV
jgi:hypothetical protein